MTPTEFVQARLAEDEDAARAVSAWGETVASEPIFVHIARHSPARVLAAVTAQREAIEVGGDEVALVLAGAWETHDDFGSWLTPSEVSEPSVVEVRE